MNGKAFTIYIVSGIPGRSKELLRALESAQDQDYDNYNIVLRMGYHDDAVEKMAGDRVVFSFFEASEIGVGKKLGRNLSESIDHFNEYVCFMDDDDYFTSNKLSRINDEFDENYVYIHNGINAVDEKGVKIDYSNSRDDFNMSSISVKKEIIDRRLFHDLDSSLDTAIYLCAIAKGNLRFIPDKLTYYTIHSSTTIGFFGDLEQWRKRKLYSYANIIQPAYEYLFNIFKDTRAEKYARKLVILNTLFVRLYSLDSSLNKLRLIDVFRIIFQKQYYHYRDTFASKVILASFISKPWILKRLYELDSKLVVENAEQKGKNSAAEIHEWK